MYLNDSNLDFVGLFGEINGTVKNVGVVDSYFNGDWYVGGVCGNNNYGTITNCYNTGTVSGNSYVGGVCGSNSGTITNCYNTGIVSGNSYIGGVCGINFCTITNCYNTGAISGTDTVGGVCGYNNLGTITNCYYLDSDEVTPVAKQDYYYIDIENIGADKLSTAHTVKIGNDVVISNYSALSYAKTVLDNYTADDNLKNLVKALYIYNRAAVRYDGWVQDGGNWYYFGEDGTMLTNSYTPDGYYVDETGKLIPGK